MENEGLLDTGIAEERTPEQPTPKTCPKCEADLRIVDSVYKSERSEDPGVPDRIYLVQKLQCLNPLCGSNETYEKRHLLN